MIVLSLFALILVNGLRTASSVKAAAAVPRQSEADWPSSNASAIGWGSASDGTVILDNDAQASHNSHDGNFEGFSTSNSYHFGKNGSVAALASSSSGGGSPFAWTHPEDWLIYPGAAAASGGDAWQGILHNLDNATVAILQHYLGHGNSKINATGTNINLHSSANASTIVVQNPKAIITSEKHPLVSTRAPANLGCRAKSCWHTSKPASRAISAIIPTKRFEVKVKKCA
ncbi:uncharacterized protein LOC129580614 [Paramacrobiotus metropolitanus]|uniref:uncharacterized protein LOC129580614 n=1 Tax=Paramacrobiotus metropolitanus TaxID=2943436 RepID=UPI00244659AB|nr:uncharacterized protein LOC129580614 [Paramacrobiotus metropolitanus]